MNFLKNIQSLDEKVRTWSVFLMLPKLQGNLYTWPSINQICHLITFQRWGLIEKFNFRSCSQRRLHLHSTTGKQILQVAPFTLNSAIETKGLFTPNGSVSVNAFVNAWKDFIDLYLYHSHQVSVVMANFTNASVDAWKWVPIPKRQIWCWTGLKITLFNLYCGEF